MKKEQLQKLNGLFEDHNKYNELKEQDREGSEIMNTTKKAQESITIPLEVFKTMQTALRRALRSAQASYRETNLEKALLNALRDSEDCEDL